MAEETPRGTGSVMGLVLSLTWSCLQTGTVLKGMEDCPGTGLSGTPWMQSCILKDTGLTVLELTRLETREWYLV